MADFNLSEILVKARDEAVKDASAEAAAATARAVKRIANPEKKALPNLTTGSTSSKVAAPPWFKYGTYAVLALVGIVVVKNVVD